MNNLTMLKEQLPEGYNMSKRTEFVDKQEEFTCPYFCKHKHTVPTTGKGTVKYDEKYTGLEYCTLFKKRLYRVTGGNSFTFQAPNCPFKPVEITEAEEKLKIIKADIKKLEIKQKEQLRLLNVLKYKRNI